MIPGRWILLGENLLQTPLLGDLPLGDLLLGGVSQAARLSAGKTLAVVLWSGLAVLTISLLVLMRTRWGQARPLSKCVALSVFAHLLLMGYAYGTRLFYEPPVELPEDPIHVQIVAADPRPSSQRQAPDQEVPPWEKLAADDVAIPDTVDLTRQTASPSPLDFPSPLDMRDADTEANADDPVEQSVPEVIQSPSPAADQVALSEPPRPTLREAPGSDPAEEATRIERPRQPVRLPDEPDASPSPAPSPARRSAGPPRESLPRREPVRRELLESLDQDAPLPPDLMDLGGRLQQLAELADPSQLATTVAGPRDQLREANNLAEGSGAGGDAATPAQPPGGVLPEMVALNTADSPAGSDPLLATAPPRRLGDGAPLPPLYRLRTGRDRLLAARRFGGDENTEAAVDAALTWLAANQSPDGRWDSDRLGGGNETRVAGHDRQGAGTEADTGITGLAVLAFLAAGETHLEGHYRETVQRGLEFLIRSQREDGNLAGSARLFAVMYCHGMASLALSEALAMTGDHRLRPYVQRAAEYTIRAQHPSTGGWRYQPGDRGDMSQFGWQVMALKSAELAGLEIPRATREACLRFLRATASGTHRGLAAYRENEGPTPTMTAEALVCRSFLNLPRNPATEDEAARLILTERPDQGRLNLYLCYYGTLGLFQIQGDAWRQWNESLRATLLRAQRSDGAAAGSWDPDTVWGSYGGRAYSTAMATLCLEVYYRYLPLYLRLQDPPAVPPVPSEP